MHVEMKLIVILRRSVQWFILNFYMSTSFKYISYQPGNLRFQCMVLFLSVIYSKCYNTAEDFFISHQIEIVIKTTARGNIISHTNVLLQS